MGVLKAAKVLTLKSARAVGLFNLAGRTAIRRERLLILCYHGISMGQEHAYSPQMFMPPDVFKRRMQVLKDSGAHVLGLEEALARLCNDRLPQRSVVLTFDDGWADFRAAAYPILRRFDFPATVYLTTYYCLYNRPVFRLALGYMLWQRRTEVIENNRLPCLPARLDLRTSAERAAIVSKLDEHAKQHDLSGASKNDLVAAVAALVGFDYEAFVRERIFQVMSPAEVSEIAQAGIDIQLHSHRHRTPLQRERFIGEILENRRHIQELTGNHNCVHYCYPSGAHQSGFLPWLREADIQSATTCISGYSEKATNRLLLPRLLDDATISETEFEAWVTGFAGLLPKRKQTALAVAPE